MSDSVVKKKSFDFAVKVVELYKRLKVEDKEFILSKQLVRSATSIGANIHEATFAASKADFINKMTIALKEANETSYWLALLVKTDFLDEDDHQSFKRSADELIRLLVSIVKTSKGL